MRKALSILLIPVFLLTATVGLSLTSYSCKAMDGESMNKPCCENSGKDGCCKKESIILKIQDAFIKAANNCNLSTSLYCIQEEVFTLTVLSNKAVSLTKGYWGNAPPDPKVGFHILYRSLII